MNLIGVNNMIFIWDLVSMILNASKPITLIWWDFSFQCEIVIICSEFEEIVIIYIQFEDIS